MRVGLAELRLHDEHDADRPEDQADPLDPAHAQAEERADEQGDHERLHGVDQGDRSRRDAGGESGIGRRAVTELREQADGALPAEVGRRDAAECPGGEGDDQQDARQRHEPPDEQRHRRGIDGRDRRDEEPGAPGDHERRGRCDREEGRDYTDLFTHSSTIQVGILSA